MAKPPRLVPLSEEEQKLVSEVGSKNLHQHEAIVVRIIVRIIRSIISNARILRMKQSWSGPR